jgi:alkylmercury lyase-like protein
MPSKPDLTHAFDSRLRLFVYRHVLRRERCPTIAEMARGLKTSSAKISASLTRLSESHAFMTQENGELWRAAPLSCIPTAFPVGVGTRSWFGNCIWDALGISAMLNKDARIGAACGCCNLDMPIEIRRGRLRAGEGIIHIAVPARHWYRDVVFT